jgi:hypothetical protein
MFRPYMIIWAKHGIEVTFVKEWQRSTQTAYKHDKKLQLQDCPRKLKHDTVQQDVEM